MQKILIVNNDLTVGGIQQSLINLLENLKGDDYKVDLLLFNNSEHAKSSLNNKSIRICKEPFLMNLYSTHAKTFFYNKEYFKWILSSMIKCLVRIFGRKNIVNLLFLFTPKTNEYDVAISYTNDIWKNDKPIYYTGVNDYVIKCVKARKKLSWVHNDPHKLGFTESICINEYKNFDKIVNVSFACKDKFDKIAQKYKNKSEVVYNMLDFEKIDELSKKNNPYLINCFNIVTVARIKNEQKRIDRVINCCAMMKKIGIKDFKWHIVGDGPDMEWLKALSKEKETEDVVIFEGIKKNPYPYMKYADVFVQTSDYEAYSMVLIESLGVGTPIICTNYESACEIIENYKNGLLVDKSEEGIVEGIKTIIQSPNLLIKMRKYIEENRISNKIALMQFKNVIGE